MADNYGLQALIEAGADAMSNMYDVSLEFADWNATVRAEGFDVPEVGVETYDTSYHGLSYKRVKTQQSFTREFSLTFRMDAQWGLYNAFTSLLSWHVNPNTGGVANANVDKVGTVKVRTINSAIVAAESSKANNLTGSPLGLEDYTSTATQTAGQITDGDNSLEWVFENCCVTKVGQPKFKTDGADVMTFQVTFIFGNTTYPGFVAQA